MPTDEQLVSETLRGSAPAFDRLVERYQERLLRFLVARCPSRADAEDALQDTFVNAYRYLESYNPRWQFSTWLYRIAIRNAARSYGREATADPDSPDDAPGPLEACIDAAERENLWLTAKRLLSDDVYAALWMRYAEDMSVKEVARALGRPQSWTRVALLRARRRLAREMGNRIGNDDATESESKAYG